VQAVRVGEKVDAAFPYVVLFLGAAPTLINMLVNVSAEEAMSEIYGAEYVSLHVRKSNKAAIGLYRDTLGFEVAKVEKKYCALPSSCCNSYSLTHLCRWRWRRRTIHEARHETMTKWDVMRLLNAILVSVHTQ
jgi:hypothetical protein